GHPSFPWTSARRERVPGGFVQPYSDHSRQPGGHAGTLCLDAAGHVWNRFPDCTFTVQRAYTGQTTLVVALCRLLAGHSYFGPCLFEDIAQGSTNACS